MKKMLILFALVCFSFPLFSMTCPDKDEYPYHPEQRPRLLNVKPAYQNLGKDNKGIKPFKPEVNKLLAPTPHEAGGKIITIC
jgi:hypothetical protein